MLSPVPVNSVGTAQVKDSSIRSGDIRNGNVRAADIGANAVNRSEIATGAVTADGLAEGSVGSREVNDDSLTGADVNESTLSQVQDSAHLAGLPSTSYVKTSTLVPFHVRIPFSNVRTIVESGPISLVAECHENISGEQDELRLVAATTVDGAFMQGDFQRGGPGVGQPDLTPGLPSSQRIMGGLVTRMRPPRTTTSTPASSPVWAGPCTAGARHAARSRGQAGAALPDTSGRTIGGIRRQLSRPVTSTV